MFDSDGRNKILIKGDPGMGKTTLGKKIGWDWGRGIFKVFSLLFFVFLKFVQPGEAIESVIIKQNPELEGLGVTAEKLRFILDKLGDRCLLILDGLDEHGLGLNEDVLKIIRNRKLINCGIVVSSRPHSTRQIQNDFSTVVRVDGFNMNEAKRFISNFFANRKKIDEIMEFSPSDSREMFPIQKCPILLSFLCYLVAEHEIDLSDKAITMGDIYTRLVKCLYKKFTIRKDIKFEPDGFVQVLKSVGKLALATLKSNNPLLEKSEVLRVVGEFAFEYGLFAGHEDSRLLGDLVADIYVTYPHRSLEEFFGSNGFCQALSEGDGLEEILGISGIESLLIRNPLFLTFSLWFLSTDTFYFQHREDCYCKITSFLASHFDRERKAAYPPFYLPSCTETTDNFFRDTLVKCKSVKTLNMAEYNTRYMDRVMKLLDRNFLNNVTKIIVGPYALQDSDDNALTLALCASSKGRELLNLLLYDYNLSHRNPQVYLHHRYLSRAPHDVTKLLTKDVKELYKYIKELHLYSFSRNFLKASGKFPHCPTFRHLTVREHHIDGSVPSAFKEAFQGGKLPRFKSVELDDCCGFTSPKDWPEEVELNVTSVLGLAPKRCSACLREEEKRREESRCVVV